MNQALNWQLRVNMEGPPYLSGIISNVVTGICGNGVKNISEGIGDGIVIFS